ncbi:unnamed protein product [Rhizophagus irregularis]|nr:unnamed protein product [Rhizophagus irregularis]
MGKGGRGRGFRTKILKNLGSGWLSGSEEWKRTKIRSGWLPSSEERKKTKIRSGWLLSSEEQKEPSFVRPFGFGVSGAASKFRRMKKKPRFVSIYELWFTSSEEWKRTKIRSGGFSNSEVQKITKIRFGLTFEDRKKRNQDS